MVCIFVHQVLIFMFLMEVVVLRMVLVLWCMCYNNEVHMVLVLEVCMMFIMMAYVIYDKFITNIQSH